MRTGVAEWWGDHSVLSALAIALLPGLENRAAIPLALLSGIPPLQALILTSILSTTMGTAVYMLLDLFFHVLPERYRKGVERRVEKARKWGALVLPLFVALPLPGSGAFTGAIVARLLGLGPLQTAVGLLVGTLIAGSLVLLAVLGLTQWL